ncbi:unnamed protein product, partial [Cyprideis torosa]
MGKPTLASAVADASKDYGRRTNLGGLSQFLAAKGHCSRIFWMIIFLACLVMTIWAVYEVLADYLEYPVNTYISVARKPVSR